MARNGRVVYMTVCRGLGGAVWTNERDSLAASSGLFLWHHEDWPVSFHLTQLKTRETLTGDNEIDLVRLQPSD